MYDIDYKSGVPMADVRLMVQDGVATLTIDRPHARNAIGLSTIVELSAALEEADCSQTSVLIVRGAGDRAFISGGDLKELAQIRDERGAAKMASSMRDLLDRVASFPVPVIAAINGHALGGGAEVAIAADIRLAADDVLIGFTQTTLAIMPAWGGIERLVDIVGRGRALQMLVSGEKLSASTAERLGLVDAVAPRQEFDDALMRLAQAFAGAPREAARRIKAVVTEVKPHVHPSSRQSAIEHFARLWVSEDHWAAVTRATAPGGPRIHSA